MAVNIQRWLPFTLTQPGADGFVEAAIATDIIPENGLVYQVNAIEFQFPANLSGLAADVQLAWSVTRDTKTAVVNLNDEDCFLTDSLSYALVTSGAAIIPQTFRYQNLIGLYIVEPYVYAQFDTIGGAGAFSLYGRIYYEEVKMNEIEILRILNNS